MTKAKLKIYDLKEMVKAIAIAKTGLNFDYFYNTNLKEIEGTDAYLYTEHMDSFLHGRNMLISCCVKLQFGDRIVNAILVDSNFDKFPKDVRDVFIHHEIGHLVNKDIDDLSSEESRKIVMERCFGIVPEMELKADAYAASVVGNEKVIDALTFMIKNTNLPFMSKLELRKRRSAIKKSARA